MIKMNSRREFLGKAAAATALAATAPLAGFGSGLGNALEQTTKNSIPSDLRITDIKCGYARGSLFVKIFTNQDIYGCGEAVDAVGGTYYMVQNMGRRLKNQSPFNVHRIFEDIRRGGFFGGAQSGVFVAVLTAIETALWDLVGKALGLPVYQLLGGKFRDRVRLYLDTALYTKSFPTPKDFADAAKKSVGLGYTAVKFDIDYVNDPDKFDRYNWTASPGELQRMYEQIAAVREAVGPKIDILVDMHGRYDTVTGIQVAKRMEPLNLMWLEEPVPAENVEAYRLIAESTSTPICAGENIYLAYGFRRLLEMGGVNIITPDLQKCGGLGEGQRCANLANLYYVPFAPHMVASMLGAQASAHVCASVPNYLIMEYQIYMEEQPYWKEAVIFDQDLWPKDGFMKVSDKPGIGVDINIEGMKKYAIPGVPFFE